MNEKKSWKLFGKLNIIDLLILLVVIVALIMVAVRFLQNRNKSEAVNTQKVVVTFYGFEDVSNFVVDALQVGDVVSLFSESGAIGTLTGFTSEPAYQLVVDPATGNNVREDLLDQCFLTITVECEGDFSRKGLTIGKNTYVVGGNYYLNVGPTRTGYRLMHMEAA